MKFQVPLPVSWKKTDCVRFVINKNTFMKVSVSGIAVLLGVNQLFEQLLEGVHNTNSFRTASKTNDPLAK